MRTNGGWGITIYTLPDGSNLNEALYILYYLLVSSETGEVGCWRQRYQAKANMRLTGFIFFIAAYGSFVRGFLDPKYASSISKGPSVPVDISSLFNSRAFASKPGDADMDGAGSKQTFDPKGL